MKYEMNVIDTKSELRLGNSGSEFRPFNNLFFPAANFEPTANSQVTPRFVSVNFGTLFLPSGLSWVACQFAMQILICAGERRQVHVCFVRPVLSKSAK